MTSATERFRHTLQAYGERPALRAPAQCLSYAGLLAEVDSRIALLDEIGAERVAIALDNGPDWVLWDLALLFSARVCVPAPGFFSASQQRHVLDSAGVDTLIGRALADGVDADFVARRRDIRQRAVAAPPVLHPGTAKITYTSGTTGQPKGVCLDAAAQLAVAGSVCAVSRDHAIARHLCVLPLATLLENVAGVYAALLAGACIDLRPAAALGWQGASGFEVGRLIAALEATRPDSLIILPQLLLALVSAAEAGMTLPDSLRFVAVGGARVAPQLLARASAVALPVFEGYGLSECASVVCLNTPRACRPGTVGRVLAHAEVRLADDGEVLVRGAHMLGYLGDAPISAEWLPTGDLGHLDDDFLVLHGRKKHQFITAFGRNVNPEWVEAELVGTGPIAQAWLYGEAMAQNLAVLVPRSADISDAVLEAAVARINAGLPDYARAHRWLRADAPFSAANGLATTNGRLRRDALRQHYRAAITPCQPESTIEANA